MGWKKYLLFFQPWDQLMSLTAQKPEQWPRYSKRSTWSLQSTESKCMLSTSQLQLPMIHCSQRWRSSSSLELRRVPKCHQNMGLLQKSPVTSSKQHPSLHLRREWPESSARGLLSSISCFKQTHKFSAGLMQLRFLNSPSLLGSSLAHAPSLLSAGGRH